MQIAIGLCPSFTELDAMGPCRRVRSAVTSGDRSRAAERHAEPSLLTPAMSSAAGRRHRRVERAEWRSIGDSILDHTGRSWSWQKT
jgi:hypothetical protein